MVYIDPLGLWEAPSWVATVNQWGGYIEAGFGAGFVAVDAAPACATGVACVFTGIATAVASAAGAVTAATSIALAIDACFPNKGACGSAVLAAFVDAGVPLVGGFLARTMLRRAPTATLDEVAKYGSTPKGRPYTYHYGVERGPKRTQAEHSGHVVDARCRRSHRSLPRQASRQWQDGVLRS